MYSLLKLVHLGALVLWLGPALGSWLVLRYSQKHEGELSATTALIYRVFFFTITLEHLAFLALLISGSLLAISFGFIHTEWLQLKLLIVACIVIPLEIVDIWLGNWKVKTLIDRRSGGQALTAREQSYIRFYHTTFTYSAMVLIPASVLAIMWLAVSKSV